MSEIILKKGEAKTIYFIYEEDGVAIDVSSGTFEFAVKKSIKSPTIVIQKNNSDFNKSQASAGIVSCTLFTTDTIIVAGLYIGEIKMILTPGINVDKSQNITFIIQDAVITSVGNSPSSSPSSSPSAS